MVDFVILTSLASKTVECCVPQSF